MPIYQKVNVRRAQTVTPRKLVRPARPKSRPAASKSARPVFRVRALVHLLKDYASFFLFAGAVIALMVLYNQFTSSALFQLRSVEVMSASPTVRAEVEQAVRQAVGAARLMDMDLEAIRQRVETLTRVREASVARVLPDKLVVDVREREPAVLIRRSNGSLAWLDEEAVEVGDFAMYASATQKVPPPAIGFAEGVLTSGARSENRDRIALYKQIEREFAAGETLWNKVDEIDLSSTKYVHVRLANSTINIALGNENYRQRFETAIQVLQAIEDYDQEQLSRFNVRDIEQVLANADRISYIYPAKNNSIVFNFSTPIAEKRSSAGTQPIASPAIAPLPKAVNAKARVAKAAARTPVARKAGRPKATTVAPRKSQSKQKQAPGKTR